MALTLEGAKLTEFHKFLQLRLSSQSMAATKLLWSTLDPTKGEAAYQAWLKKQVLLSGVFDKKSAEAAAEYVKKFRIAEGFPGGPVVGVKDFDPHWAEESMSYNGSNKVKALMDQGLTAKEAMAKAAPNVMSAAQRLTLGGGRRVVDKSTLANPESSGWRRVSDGHPCAFCAMLVSRGDAYRSEKSAGLGRHWHKKCGCTVEEVFGEWTPTAEEQQYVDSYDAAAKHLDDLGKPHAQTQILEHMRLNGKFNDSPVLNIPEPKHLPPQPYPKLGANFRIDHTGQIWKGYNYKIQGQTGTSWKKVDETGKRLHVDPPTKKQLAAIAEKKAAEEAAAAAKKAEEEAAKKAAEAAALLKKKLDALGPGYRVDHTGQFWKGYKWKIKGKEGTSWKKVDETGKRLHVDPPPKKKIAPEPAKVEPKGSFVYKPAPGTTLPKPKEFTSTVTSYLKAKGWSPDKIEAYKHSLFGQNAFSSEYDAQLAKHTLFGGKPPAAVTAPKATPKKTPSEPDVVLKNEYQKSTAAAYGWGQPELKAWVKSGLTMTAYKASLTKGVEAPFVAVEKITAAPGKGGMSWASNHWPGASKYTEAERRGFQSYTGSGYTATNNTLRETAGKRGANPGLEQAFKRSTSVVPNDTIAYRGVRSAKALGLTTDSGDLSKLVGAEYIERGYMSTAVEGSGFGGAINLTVKIPKGHRAVFVAHQGDALSVYGSSEKELLLDRGTRFKIVSAQKSGSNWHVTIEVIPPPVR